MNDPAVLFYTSDFLTGVIDMTMEERGQYITLLCYQHQKGHIKEETIRLLVGSCSVNVLKHFNKDENGNYYNERMDLEKEKRHVFTESRRENGKKGGRPKKQDDKPSGKPKENLVDNHKDNHMGNDNDNDNINSNIEDIINNNIDIYNYIEQNFGRTLSPIELEQISEWEDNDLTRYAVKQAVLNGVYSFKYVDKILNSYKNNNIKTVQQAQEADRKFNERKEEQNKYKGLSFKEQQHLREQEMMDKFVRGEI